MKWGDRLRSRGEAGETPKPWRSDRGQGPAHFPPHAGNGGLTLDSIMDGGGRGHSNVNGATAGVILMGSVGVTSCPVK